MKIWNPFNNTSPDTNSVPVDSVHNGSLGGFENPVPQAYIDHFREENPTGPQDTMSVRQKAGKAWRLLPAEEQSIWLGFDNSTPLNSTVFSAGRQTAPQVSNNMLAVFHRSPTETQKARYGHWLITVCWVIWSTMIVLGAVWVIPQLKLCNDKAEAFNLLFMDGAIGWAAVFTAAVLGIGLLMNKKGYTEPNRLRTGLSLLLAFVAFWLFFAWNPRQIPAVDVHGRHVQIRDFGIIPIPKFNPRSEHWIITSNNLPTIQTPTFGQYIFFFDTGDRNTGIKIDTRKARCQVADGFTKEDCLVEIPTTHFVVDATALGKLGYKKFQVKVLDAEQDIRKKTFIDSVADLSRGWDNLSFGQQQERMKNFLDETLVKSNNAKVEIEGQKDPTNPDNQTGTKPPANDKLTGVFSMRLGPPNQTIPSDLPVWIRWGMVVSTQPGSNQGTEASGAPLAGSTPPGLKQIKEINGFIENNGGSSRVSQNKLPADIGGLPPKNAKK